MCFHRPKLTLLNNLINILHVCVLFYSVLLCLYHNDASDQTIKNKNGR